jgi:hypothetical protein
MRIHSLVAGLAAFSVLAACESDEKKLDRLRTEEASACLPVFVADSAESARMALLARIHARNTYGMATSEIPAMQADLAEAKVAMAYYAAKAKESPVQLAAEQKTAIAQRTKCDLAKRSVSLFMAGR